MVAPLRAPRRSRHGALTVLVDPVPGPLTAIAVTVRAGSRLDGRHAGIAHMAEHMVFQGTRTMDQLALNRRAAELGGEHDADTGHDDVTYHAEVLNEHVDDALALLAEQLFRSTVPADRFAKEQRVVVDEIRGRRDDPVNHAHERAWAAFFQGSVGHPICGTIGSVRRLEAAAVRGFLARHYTPANTVVALVGGAGAGRLRRAVERHFPARGGRRAHPPAVRTGRTGLLRLRWRDATQAVVVRVAVGPTDPREGLALALALEIVGADPDARLFQEVRERLGLGYDVDAAVEHGDGWGAMVISASTGPHQADRLRDAIDAVCREATAGFDDDELARAKRKVGFRFARLADARLDRAIAHATREACGHPPLALAARLVTRIGRAEVEAAWRRAIAAPTLTTVLTD